MLYSIARPILFTQDPEKSHNLTLAALNTSLGASMTRLMVGKVANKPCTVMGIEFPNPVGLAAGLDKNGEYINGLAHLGFGFIEVGTVTPRPQQGNPKPRLFRIPKAQGIINRMGFNNHGVDRLISNVQQANYQGILGINLGKNATTPLENALDDYIMGLLKVYPYADYLVVNISSPNTKDLRQLQHGDELNNLLRGLKQAHEQACQQYDKYVPLAVKIAPDMDNEELKQIADKLLQHKIDAVIATNTTIAHDKVKQYPHGKETGGLSGAPLTERATQVIWQLKQILQEDMPIIAAGGIMTPNDAKEKLQVGASLVQVYSGLIYYGPTLVRDIVQEL
ncbi:quinone-dependent dihydroorotate dehydrogenase [Candidatus Albibeggiatoa sp. nov. BB20]|uniref:quinone-dependent dihydroorotate dehydrogenase n=1 Tax=Candidatus Albibeggiatoa sp. nov. BB20 TaxID=3162723 RepID=UPI0033658F61